MNQSSCLAKWEPAICWLGIAMRRWKRAESRVNECKEGGGLKRGRRGGRIMPWHFQWASESSLHSRWKRRMVGFRSNTKAFTPLIRLTLAVTRTDQVQLTMVWRLDAISHGEKCRGQRLAGLNHSECSVTVQKSEIWTMLSYCASRHHQVDPLWPLQINCSI